MSRGEPTKTIGHARAGGEKALTVHCLANRVSSSGIDRYQAREGYCIQIKDGYCCSAVTDNPTVLKSRRRQSRRLKSSYISSCQVLEGSLPRTLTTRICQENRPVIRGKFGSTNVFSMPRTCPGGISAENASSS